MKADHTSSARTLPIWLVCVLTLFATPVFAGVDYTKSAPKGGVGPAERGVMIILNSDKNALLMQKHEKGRPAKWFGKVSGEKEIVFTDGKRVSHSSYMFDPAMVMVFIFSPEQVQYIDLGDSEAGVYPRSKTK